MIRELEVRGLSAWPAAEVEPLDGWLLCSSGGATRRVNSVQPLEDGSLSLDARIARCERFYRDRGQRVHFKLTRESVPNELDEILAERGYALADPTSVQVLDLESAATRAVPDVRVERKLSPGWFEACARLNEVAGEHQPALRGILDRIDAPMGYASIEGASGVDALALGVLQDDYLGLFEIVTAPPLRGKGLGTQVIAALLHWARGRGARRAWLQVVAANTPAWRLYEDLGFQEVYQYWYRSVD